MAKEFKDFDDKYRKLQGTLLGDEDAVALKKRADEIRGWEYYKDITIWANAEVREAVYESESAQEWQKFRVSLKGWSTEMKLARLEARYEHIREAVQRELEELGYEDRHLIVYSTSLCTAELMEKCRIDNYIGALRRGGQLDADFRIVR